MIIPIAEWDTLEFRWRTFQSCCTAEMLTPDDGLPSLCIAEFAQTFNLSDKDKVLLAWLYGMCYNPLSVMYIYSEIAEYRPITEEWWEDNKSILQFEPDKVKIKYMNKFIPAWESYQKNEQEFQNAVLNGSFEDLKRATKHLAFFKTHAMFLACDVLQACFGNSLNCLPKTLEWQTRTLPTEGALLVTGHDDLLPYKEGTLLSQEVLTDLNSLAESAKETTGIDIAEMESVLCAFRKLYKGTRYAGYYRDRHLEDINNSQLPEWVKNCNLEYRARLLPPELLGECSGWDGIRKEKCKEFVLYGTI